MVSPLSVCLCSAHLTVELGQATFGSTGEAYAGPYSVEPLAVAQNLLTKGRLMADNVEIRAVYFSQISNIAGGKTVNIGGID